MASEVSLPAAATLLRRLECGECGWAIAIFSESAAELRQCPWCGWEDLETSKVGRFGAGRRAICSVHGEFVVHVLDGNVEPDDFLEDMFCPFCGGSEAPAAHPPDPTSVRTFAWIMYALALATQKEPANYEGISLVADGINHAVPTHKELQNSLGWLIGKGLVQKSGSKYVLSAEGHAFMAQVPGATTSEVWAALTKALGALDNGL